MHMPAWKPTWWRRTQFLWIIPTVLVIYLPTVLVFGIREYGSPFRGLGSIWTGDRRK